MNNDIREFLYKADSGMKKCVHILSAVFYCLFPELLPAQEYHHFLSPDKEWHCKVHDPDNWGNPENEWIDYIYKTTENTIFDGEQWYRIECHVKNGTAGYEYDEWFVEQDGKIYKSDKPGGGKELVYNFSMRDGEKETFNVVPDFQFSLTQKSSIEIPIQHTTRWAFDNNMTLYIKTNAGEQGEIDEMVLDGGSLLTVEGIGNLISPFDFYELLVHIRAPRLAAVYEGGMCVYSEDDLQRICKLMYAQCDINKDGKVDITDVVAVVNTIAGDTRYKDSTDVNSDGRTDITDVVDIINVIAGQ